MPATRASGMAMPSTAWPSNNCPTSDGTNSNASPVAPSATAETINTFFIVRLLPDGSDPVGCTELVLRAGVLLRFELESELVDLAGELERNVVAIFHQRDTGAGVLTHIEGFVLRERDRNGVLHGILGHFLAVHGQHPSSALAQLRTVGLEVEDDGVLAGFQFRAFPHRALQIEQVIKEHHLALVDAELAFAQEQTVATEAPALGDNHAFGAAFWNLDLGGDGVGFAQDARRSAGRHAAQLTRISEDRLSRREARARRIPARERRVVERQHVVLLRL